MDRPAGGPSPQDAMYEYSYFDYLDGNHDNNPQHDDAGGWLPSGGAMGGADDYEYHDYHDYQGMGMGPDGDGDSSDGSNTTFIVTAVAVSGVVLIIVVVGLIAYFCGRRSKNSKPKESTPLQETGKKEKHGKIQQKQPQEHDRSTKSHYSQSPTKGIGKPKAPMPLPNYDRLGKPKAPMPLPHYDRSDPDDFNERARAFDNKTYQEDEYLEPVNMVNPGATGDLYETLRDATAGQRADAYGIPHPTPPKTGSARPYQALDRRSADVEAGLPLNKGQVTQSPAYGLGRNSRELPQPPASYGSMESADDNVSASGGKGRNPYLQIKDPSVDEYNYIQMK